MASRHLNWEFCSENPFSKPPGLAGDNSDGKPTLMLSANSSNAFAPVVSMEVISPGNLFFVPAAVPWNSPTTDQRKRAVSDCLSSTYPPFRPVPAPHSQLSMYQKNIYSIINSERNPVFFGLLGGRRKRCCNPSNDQDLPPLVFPLVWYLT